MKIRKGDTVMVVTGREKGKTGRVMLISTKKGTALIEKLNLVRRHQRPSQQHKQGGIIEKEAPIRLSNLMYYDAKASKASRIGFKYVDGKKFRVVKKTGEMIEAKGGK